ncbi:MAG: V4R domain-containing protein [Methanoregulaceae archaeon]
MNPKFTGKTNTQEPVVFYSSRQGIQAIQSPVKVRILTLLQEREMPFDEIVVSLGKVKSTISVHLNDLESQGIIGSKGDPYDARRKLFFMKADFLGHASSGERLGDTNERGRVGEVTLENEPSDFYRLMFRNIRVALLAEGINIDPILHRAGLSVGQQLYPSIAAEDLGTFLTNAAAFWEHHRLGRVTVESVNPISLRVTDCFECEDLPKIGRPACAFEGGILLSLFSEFFGEEPLVCETACYAMGNKYCQFVISRLEPETVDS